jgi:predicted transposase YdaD
MKLLLENSWNVRDLLLLTREEVVELIDFDRLTLVPTTFVQRDYRHVESDVVLQAPVRRPAGQRRRKLLIYILIEHQSEPDLLMPLRVLEYVVQIYKTQIRDWSKRHRSFAGIRLQPVLPVVFYTGIRPWDRIGSVADLVELRERFQGLIPALEPLYINLSAIEPGILESEGGFFGWVLRLVQQRRARLGEFKDLLAQVVDQLDTMPSDQRLRWLELLSYIQALVYHERERAEQPGLREIIEASVQRDEFRQEVQTMRQTMADWLRQEGKKEGRKEGRKQGEVRALRRTLLQQLHARFGDVPEELLAAVQATRNVEQLEAWLGRIVTAATLEDMNLRPRV